MRIGNIVDTAILKNVDNLSAMINDIYESPIWDL